MPERIRKVLDTIVTRYAVLDEQKDIDLSAAASETGAQLAAEKRAAAQRETQRAGELADAFRAGLIAAYRRRQAGESDLVLDDRRPDENRMADALIGFLVRFELAASRSDETEPNHYVYSIEVDWPRLGEVARAAGVDLERTLAESTS